MLPPGFDRVDDLVGVCGVLDYRPCDIRELLAGPPGVRSQQVERLLHVDTGPLSEYPLGLLNDDSGVQSNLQLLGDQFRTGDNSLMKYAYRGDVGKGLADCDLCWGEATDVLSKQVQGTDMLIAQTQR